MPCLEPGHLDRPKEEVLPSLDNVCIEQSSLWELFCTPLQRAKQGKILVTTRNKTVAKLVQTFLLLKLPERRSCVWELLQRSLIQVSHLRGHVMHDLTHAVARFVASEEFLPFESNIPIEIPPHICQLSVKVSNRFHDSLGMPDFRL